ncbi:MAG: hypothetical protein ABSD72_06045 [Terracidiphilus sp.]
MSEATPFVLSRCFTQLISRKVTFVQTPLAPPDAKIKQIFGIYNLLPHNTAIIVKADLPLMGSLGGALVGLPDTAVKEHLRAAPLEELLRDAINEVLNIASAAITNEGRAVFVKMVTDPTYIDGAAGKVYLKPDHRSYFNVQIDGYQGGKFNILSQFVPSHS